MIRYYLVPVVVGATGVRGPKYFNFRGAPAPVLFPSALFDLQHYGPEPSMLLCSDMSDPDDALLAAQSDVTKMADNLDSQVGAANLAPLQAALAANQLPGGMVTAATTYRKVVRGIIGIFAIAQCMAGKGQPILGVGVTLNTVLSALPGQQEVTLMACGTGQGYDLSGITLASTIRQFLVTIANQASPITLLDVVV